MAGDVAATSADLLFSRAPVITAEDPGTQAALNEMYDDSTHAMLLEAAELGSALGGVFLRVVWDTDVAAMPWLDKVPADAAIPHFSYNRLAAVTFWRVLSDDGQEVVRHLETHIPGQNRIRHAVYVGDQTDLGKIYPLSDFPETAQFAQYLTEGDSIVFPDQPRDASTVVYIPNIRPNRLWRDLGPQAEPLGRSDYSGSESLLDGLDEVWTSWMRDIQLGKARLIVPQGYVDSIGRGKGAVFDPDRQVYSPISSLAGSGTSDIMANQFKIRWLEHQKTVEKTISEIVRRAGYSAQDFGEEPEAVAMTATEIEARERRSLITRDKKILYWRPGLRDILYGLLSVRHDMFGDHSVIPVRPEVNFAEVVLPDPLQMAQTANQLASAEAASKQVLVKMIHPDWTAAEVNEEVDRIAEELGWDMLGRARLTLRGPDTETLRQDIEDIAAPVPVPDIPVDIPGLRDTGEGGETSG